MGCGASAEREEARQGAARHTPRLVSVASKSHPRRRGMSSSQMSEGDSRPDDEDEEEDRRPGMPARVASETVRDSEHASSTASPRPGAVDRQWSVADVGVSLTRMPSMPTAAAAAAASTPLSDAVAKPASLPASVLRDPHTHAHASSDGSAVSFTPTVATAAATVGATPLTSPTRPRVMLHRKASNIDERWRNPVLAAELIAAHAAEDPQAFRDHLAIQWRLEHMPLPAPIPATNAGSSANGTPSAPNSARLEPSAPGSRHGHPSASPQARREGDRATLIPSASSPVLTGSKSSPVTARDPNAPPSNSPAAAAANGYHPGLGVSMSARPAPVTSRLAAYDSSPTDDECSLFLSLGPSNGAGDKLASSELREQEEIVSFSPMLLPMQAMNGGDREFKIQVQVWQRRVAVASAPAVTNPSSGSSSSTAPAASGGSVTTTTLLAYVDVSVKSLLLSHERGTSLTLRPAPLSSCLPGTRPLFLPIGAALRAHTLAFYVHSTPAVLHSHPGRWPRQLAGPQTDCLWRAQMQGIKLPMPRACTHHPSSSGDTSGPVAVRRVLSNGVGSSLAAALAEAGVGGNGSGGGGVCAFQIFRGSVSKEVAAALREQEKERGRTREREQQQQQLPTHAASYSSIGVGVVAATPRAESPAPSAPALTLASVGATSWTLVHHSELAPLSRYPKFAEFSRPLAQICEGAYGDRSECPLLIQVLLSHDVPTAAHLARVMPLGLVTTDPTAAVTGAMEAMGMHACGVLHTLSHMKELVAGKTKLRLHVPEDATPLAAGSDATTSPNAVASDTGASALSGDAPDPSLGAADVPSIPLSSPRSVPLAKGGLQGTVAFNISQIFSNRASLDALARRKIAQGQTAHGRSVGDAKGESSQPNTAPVVPAAASHAQAAAQGGITARSRTFVDLPPSAGAPALPAPSSDGFDEAGVLRSNAYLASLLPPVGSRRHHRPGSHPRGHGSSPSPRSARAESPTATGASPRAASAGSGDTVLARMGLAPSASAAQGNTTAPATGTSPSSHTQSLARRLNSKLPPPAVHT